MGIVQLTDNNENASDKNNNRNNPNMHNSETENIERVINEDHSRNKHKSKSKNESENKQEMVLGENDNDNEEADQILPSDRMKPSILHPESNGEVQFCHVIGLTPLAGDNFMTLKTYYF